MSTHILEEAAGRLTQLGYFALPQPVNIGGVLFEFAHFLVGPSGSLTTIVVPQHDETPARLLQKVQALAQALDTSESRRSLTLISAQPLQIDDATNELSSYARVLFVSSMESLDDDIASLLPLKLPSAEGESADPIPHAISKLSRTDAEFLASSFVISSSSGGAESVRSAFKSWMRGALVLQEGSD